MSEDEDGKTELEIVDTNEEAIEGLFQNMRGNFRDSQDLMPTCAKMKQSEAPQNVSCFSANYDSTAFEEGARHEQLPKFDYAERHLHLKAKTTLALRQAVMKNKEEYKDIEELSTKIGPSHFNAIKLLGVGSFGEVFLVEKKDTKTLHAMKILRKDKVFKNNLVRYVKTEKNVLKTSKHPFICGIDYSF